MPQYADTVTIRPLLHHISGLRDHESLVRLAGLATNDYDDKFILKILARQKNISFKTGLVVFVQQFEFLLLGRIVARVSGKSLRAFADENIFKPLGMKNTRLADNRFEIVKNRAQGYVVGSGNSIRARPSLDDLVGDGGILTTVEDLYLWEIKIDPKKSRQFRKLPNATIQVEGERDCSE